MRVSGVPTTSRLYATSLGTREGGATLRPTGTGDPVLQKNSHGWSDQYSVYTSSTKGDSQIRKSGGWGFNRVTVLFRGGSGKDWKLADKPKNIPDPQIAEKRRKAPRQVQPLGNKGKGEGGRHRGRATIRFSQDIPVPQKGRHLCWYSHPSDRNEGTLKEEGKKYETRRTLEPRLKRQHRKGALGIFYWWKIESSRFPRTLRVDDHWGSC